MYLRSQQIYTGAFTKMLIGQIGMKQISYNQENVIRNILIIKIHSLIPN